MRPRRRRSWVLIPPGASAVTASDEVMSSLFRKSASSCGTSTIGEQSATLSARIVSK
jgi:hypothetical protein